MMLVIGISTVPFTSVYTNVSTQEIIDIDMERYE
jgi:hypothetical protein